MLPANDHDTGRKRLIISKLLIRFPSPGHRTGSTSASAIDQKHMNQTLTSELPSNSPTGTPNRDLFITGKWCPDELRRIIAARSENQRRPTHLFLGRREAGLLRDYLREHEATDEEIELEGREYMGLTIVLHDSESLLRLAGDLYMGHLSRTGRHREPIDTSTSWWRLSG